LQGEALEGYKDLLHDSIQKNKELEDLINQLQNKVGQAILVANNLGGGGGGSSSRRREEEGEKGGKEEELT